MRKFNNITTQLFAALLSAGTASAPLLATNGMSMEGFGPIAAALGGASMAYDNGTAAMMNNPATLSMMAEGSRLDIAVGLLSPKVSASMMASPSMMALMLEGGEIESAFDRNHPAGLDTAIAMGGPHSDDGLGLKWKSRTDLFAMPAIGWAKRSGNLTYGVGAFAQGGMGTEYSATSPGASFVFAPSKMMGGGLNRNNMPISGVVSSWEEMSEAGVMRVIFPVSYRFGERFTLGGSIDYVRATMDMKMVMTGGMMEDMMAPHRQTIGRMGGTMAALMFLMQGSGDINHVYGGQFDFADSDPLNGRTEGSGVAGKLGFTYRLTSQLTVGGAYHSKTAISDLKGSATMSMAVNMRGEDMVMPVNGRIKVRDFQWPHTFIFGFAYQATERLMLVADFKHLGWREVMKDFNLSFTATDSPFLGSRLDATLYQDWRDQTVVQLGVAYKATESLTLRAGANIASNPVPKRTTHYLFPATLENHFTAGIGYLLTPSSELTLSVSHAPEVALTSGMGMEIRHSQTNGQLLYSHLF